MLTRNTIFFNIFKFKHSEHKHNNHHQRQNKGRSAFYHWTIFLFLYTIFKFLHSMISKAEDINYLLIKIDNYYRVEERPIFDISDIKGTYLSSTTHRQDAYKSAEVLNYIISKR